MTKKEVTIPAPASVMSTGSEDKEWLTAEAFAAIEGMPSTAKGARLRLEKLAEMHPEIKRRRSQGKGFKYHVSAASMPLKSEREASTMTADEKLNLWIQLFKSMTPSSREKLLQLALKQVADDLATSQPHANSDI